MSAVSIVIISKNERGLTETLDALGRLDTELTHETVVVDSSDGVLDDIQEQFPAVTWVRFEPTGAKRVTIPEQRNLGVRTAKSDIVVFIDAGCLPTPGWLDALVTPIRSGAETVTVGAYTSRGTSVYDVQQFSDGYIEEAPTLNMAFSRAAFDAVGGFDEAFSYSSDIDFCWRVRDLGHRILMVAGALVLVDWGGTRRQTKRAWYYGAGRARLYRKHLNRLSQLPRRDPILAAYPVFLLGLPLTLFFPFYPLLLLIPLWRNRRAHPFRTMADHLTYGAGALGFLVGLAS
ncbi:glycosyltransferase [Kineosporia sp. J2-2]|uniref:Glycosyltransferase n=1 Tax=Kineosporia corallincola TaxID=2835133 RepID=A0ABS5TLS5_9ACTN|nr:glycosyltransferase [Kineosporia corallincola]MBT0772042.1 glycosyltransferase [Kineosporia corallincola]